MVQASESCLRYAADLVQSALRSQATAGSLLSVPAAVMSPGIGSLHVPRSYPFSAALRPQRCAPGHAASVARATTPVSLDDRRPPDIRNRGPSSACGSHGAEAAAHPRALM